MKVPECVLDIRDASTQVRSSEAASTRTQVRSLRSWNSEMADNPVSQFKFYPSK